MDTKTLLKAQLEARQVASQIERASAILSTTTDYANRRIYLFGDIDDGAAYRVTIALSVLDSSPGPITILMNSPGGNVESGWAIFDSIQLAKNPVTIVGMGAVMSMAAIIMQAADLRIMMPRARFMIHTGHFGADGAIDSDKLIAMGEEVNSMRERFIDILQERTGLPLAKVRELLIKESYFSAAEALRHGFIDGVATVAPKAPPEVEPAFVPSPSRKKRTNKKSAAKKKKAARSRR